jgi:hypothetical protein
MNLVPVPQLGVENYEDDDPAIVKALITETSHRTIPIQAELIDMGFLDYTRTEEDSGNIHLFPALAHDRGGNRGAYISRTFMNAFRDFGETNPETGLGTKPLRIHSVRHPYRKTGFEVPDQDFLEIAMGHYVVDGFVQTYAGRFTPCPMYYSIETPGMFNYLS